MGYQQTVPRVAARQGLQTTALAAVSRGALRARGAEFEQELRAAIDEAARASDEYPEPVTLVRDVARGRPASLQQIGAALVAVAASPVSDTQWQRLWVRLAAWGASLRPSSATCLYEAFASETRQQAEADVHQALLPTAVDRQDRAAIARAITVTESHVATQQLFLAAMRRALHELERQPARRITVRPALVAAGAR